MSCDTIIAGLTPEQFIGWGVEAREDCPGSLWQSGIVRRTEQLDMLAMGDACSFTAGGWTHSGTGPNKTALDAGGAFEAFAAFDCNACDEPVGKQFKMQMLDRQKCWFDRDAQNLCNVFPGSTTDAIADLMGNWTVDVRETDILATIIGLYLNNVADDNSDLVVDANDATINVSDPNHYSLCSQTELRNRFGCKASELGGTIMHTRVANHLSKTGQMSEVASGMASTCDASCFEMSGLFNGKPVLAVDDDRLIQADGNYLSISFKDGAIGYGEGRAITPMERDRDVCADNGKGAWKTIVRERFLLHPMGWNFEPTLAANQDTAMPADLANAASWCRVVDPKNSGFGFTISSQV